MPKGEIIHPCGVHIVIKFRFSVVGNNRFDYLHVSPASIVLLSSLSLLVFLSMIIIYNSRNLTCYLLTPGERSYLRWNDNDDFYLNNNEENSNFIPLDIKTRYILCK